MGNYINDRPFEKTASACSLRHFARFAGLSVLLIVFLLVGFGSDLRAQGGWVLVKAWSETGSEGIDHRYTGIPMVQNVAGDVVFPTDNQMRSRVSWNQTGGDGLLDLLVEWSGIPQSVRAGESPTIRLTVRDLGSVFPSSSESANVTLGPNQSFQQTFTISSAGSIGGEAGLVLCQNGQDLDSRPPPMIDHLDERDDCGSVDTGGEFDWDSGRQEESVSFSLDFPQGNPSARLLLGIASQSSVQLARDPVSPVPADGITNNTGAVFYLYRWEATGVTSDAGDSRDEELPWEIVIAIGALGMAAVAAAARRLATKKRKSPGRPPATKPEKIKIEREKTVGYVLQLSADRLKLKLDQPVVLTIQCWKVDEKGAYSAAKDAKIEVTVSKGPPTAIALRPDRGTSRLDTQVLLTEQPSEPKGALRVVARAPGGSTEAQVLLEFDPGLHLFVDVSSEPSSGF